MPLRIFARLLVGIAVLGCSVSYAQPAVHGYALPTFTDPGRRAHVDAILPEIDKLFIDLAAAEHLPGLVYGVVLDGQLIHARSLGLANRERKIPVTIATRFRIASMTKSFVVLATLKLRDEGKLSLDDPVEKYLPEFRAVHLPLTDAPGITLRHLMTMTTGLPEDNPWGDRQMELTNAELARFVGGGLSFSNPPGQTYEYSNLGFMLLGKIVSQVAGLRFQDFITQNILRPLGMTNTVWEFTAVPPEQFALGYQWVHDAWRPEPILHDGDAAAIGGLITTMDDFARYVSFHLDAWPARDEPDHGPVRRATVREMQQPRILAATAPVALASDGKTPNPNFSFYAYGLCWTRDSLGVVKVGHGGGLPGYGSNYCFAPDHGVAVIAFCNLRYGPVYDATDNALSLLIERAPVAPRANAVSPILALRQRQVVELIQAWSPALAAEITAENFFLDRTLADWIAETRTKFAELGAIKTVGPLQPENQLRGMFTLTGEKGKMQVHFTLTPERDPKLQYLELTASPKP